MVTKTALVTGASSMRPPPGSLLDLGYVVYGAARRADRLQQLCGVGVGVGVQTVSIPKTRYAMGFGARPLLVMRRVLPDRVFDALISRVGGMPA